MRKIEDIYFDNFDEALKIAEEQNVFGPYDNLQICYYDGPIRKKNLKNLIHLPLNNFSETLIHLGTRIPTKIIHDNKNLVEFELNNFLEKKEKIHLDLKNKILKKHLNFNEKLRIYISAEYGGKVVLRTYKFLSKLFNENGFDVYFDINDELTLMDDYRRAKSIEEFNPHLTFNINRLRNEQIHPDTFNFIWFMDPTLILFDDSSLNIRKRDYIFYIGNEIYSALKNKKIPEEKIIHQFLTPDYSIFKFSENIKKENKVIFVGQNYFEVIEPTKTYKKHPVVNELTNLFNNNEITFEKLNELKKKYSSTIKRDEHIEVFIYPAVVRQEIIKWICQQDKIKVEIYGEGWNNIVETKTFSKGVIKSEEKLNEIYNSAKYSLVVHSSFMYIPKLFESSATNCIPLVYRGITTLDDFKHNKNILTFSDKKSLYNSLDKKTEKSPIEISKQISTKSILDKILSIIQKEFK